jgi:hypothetical protein
MSDYTLSGFMSNAYGALPSASKEPTVRDMLTSPQALNFFRRHGVFKLIGTQAIATAISLLGLRIH